MKQTFFIIIVILLSTSCKQQSNLFSDCSYEQAELQNWLTVKDTLGNYHIKYPDPSWMPMSNFDSNGNGITVGDTSLGYLRIFSVTELEKKINFLDWDKQQKDIESEFNVIEKGTIFYKNQDVHWNLIKFDIDNMWSLYLTVDHPIEERFYTLNLTVEDGEDIKSRICTLESFLYGFEILN